MYKIIYSLYFLIKIIIVTPSTSLSYNAHHTS